MATSALFEKCSPAVSPFSGTTPGWQGWQAGTQPAGAAAGSQWCVLPRCTLKFEKITGGLKIHCHCEEEVACGTLQNLCRMLCEGTCSCWATCNGIPVCQCSLTLGITKCEFTKDGCCITCTSGDKACCAMIQACCDNLSCCCQSGCCCYICFNNTPVCCGTC